LIWNNLGFLPLHDTHHRVCGTQIDSDDFFTTFIRCHENGRPFLLREGEREISREYVFVRVVGKTMDVTDDHLYR
jgi:hypothetical protein